MSTFNLSAPSRANRAAVLSYGVFCYVGHWVALLYTMGFLINLGVPKGIDAGEPGPLGLALVTDVGLVGLFAVAHWIMARDKFKSWWTQFVPPPVERSTYVLVTSALLALLFYTWMPIPNVIWTFEHPSVRLLLIVIYAAGWLLAIYATFPINHWELFGLRQTWLYFKGMPHTEAPGYPSIVYRLIPHPIFFGYLIAIWVTPTMTVGHLALALILSALIYVAWR
jgi:hypothetical protein